MSPVTGLVAGSGIDLLPLLRSVDKTLGFQEAFGLEGAVPGHANRFVLGKAYDGSSLIVQCGRLHLYEGLSWDRILAPVRMMIEMGVERVLLSNAAGGLCPAMQVGGICAATRVRAWPWQHGPRLDLPPPPILLEACEHQGDYWWMHGPSYETPAEIAALQELGGAAVGMSAAPEFFAYHQAGIPTGVVSVITNVCGSGEILSHDAVLESAQRANGRLLTLIADWLGAA